jgi:hypothetical protein
MRWFPIRLNGNRLPAGELVLDLRRFHGAVRLLIPPSLGPRAHERRSDREIDERLEKEIANLRRLEERQVFNRAACAEMIRALEAVRGQPLMTVHGGNQVAVIDPPRLEPGEHATVFVGIEAPAHAKAGERFRIDARQPSPSGKQPGGGVIYDVRVGPPSAFRPRPPHDRD